MKIITMRWLRRLLVAAVVLFLIWFGANLLMRFWLEKIPNQVELIEALPQSVRRAYLDDLFDNPEPGFPYEHCWECHLRLVGALAALKQDTEKHQNSFGFDYAKLIPLLRNGMDGFYEPIPGRACHVILLRNEPRVFALLVKQYANEKVSYERCIMNGARQFHEMWPQSYPALKNSLLQVPELLPLLQELP